MADVPGTGPTTSVVRDLLAYADDYRALPFEPIQLGYRRRLVLEQVQSRGPRRVLEIGCGDAPLFPELPGVECVVIEPTPTFSARARDLARWHPGVTVVQELAEEVEPASLGGPFDVVVLSCLLHEVPDPQQLLARARAFCGASGTLHVNVPSARSLHRVLAVAMGLIAAPDAESPMQRTMQQQRVYDADGLEEELVRAGFVVQARGGIFVKPFTHAQMQRLVDDGFLTTEILDGLDSLARSSPELGSEIWADAVPGPGPVPA